MPRAVFEFHPPERFIAGTVGPPGSRSFFLQARRGPRLATIALEKQQVSVLATRIDELLDEVLRRDGDASGIPEQDPAPDQGPLDTPIEPEFVVGTMSLAWEPGSRSAVVECFALLEGDAGDEDLNDDDDAAEGAVLRVWLPGPMARGFARRALAVVAAGRPPCPFCARPLDAEGHICPRANGYQR